MQIGLGDKVFQQFAASVSVSVMSRVLPRPLRQAVNYPNSYGL